MRHALIVEFRTEVNSETMYFAEIGETSTHSRNLIIFKTFCQFWQFWQFEPVIIIIYSFPSLSPMIIHEADGHSIPYRAGSSSPAFFVSPNGVWPLLRLPFSPIHSLDEIS